MNLKIELKPQQGYNKVFDVGEYGLKLTKFGVLKLAAGTSYEGDTGESEVAFVLIGGNFAAEGDGWSFEVTDGRKSPFTGKPHCLYLPRRVKYTIKALSDVELAYNGSPATRDTAKPTLNERTSPPEIPALLLRIKSRSSSKAAPPIAGIASRKENSAASLLRIRQSTPAEIVLPEREIPGVIATACAQPISSALPKLRFSAVSAVSSLELCFSLLPGKPKTQPRKVAVTINPNAATKGDEKIFSSQPESFRPTPTTAAGTDPAMTSAISRRRDFSSSMLKRCLK